LWPLCKDILNGGPADGPVLWEFVCSKVCRRGAGLPLKASPQTARNMVGRRSQSLAGPTLRFNVPDL